MTNEELEEQMEEVVEGFLDLDEGQLLLDDFYNNLYRNYEVLTDE